jgi:hypothetical protein
MRSTFQNSGTALSVGAFFALMIAGLADSLPKSLSSGLQRQGVPAGIAHHVSSLPPVSSLFAAILGVNPIQHLLATGRTLSGLPRAAQRTLTGREFFPRLISGPFHHGLVLVFSVSAALAALAALASLLRGRRFIDSATTGESFSSPEPPPGSGAKPDPSVVPSEDGGDRTAGPTTRLSTDERGALI